MIWDDMLNKRKKELSEMDIIGAMACAAAKVADIARGAGAPAEVLDQVSLLQGLICVETVSSLFDDSREADHGEER
jgi:hypothetical protein